MDQAGGCQLRDAPSGIGLVDLQGVGDPRQERAAGQGAAAGDGERQRHPLRLGEAGVNAELARVAARKWHYAVLATLNEFGPASQAQLSQRTGIYHSDLVAVITELTGRGQVERSPDPADRRRNVITLTPGGRRQLRKLDELLADAENEVFAPPPDAAGTGAAHSTTRRTGAPPRSPPVNKRLPGPPQREPSVGRSASPAGTAHGS
ncbi:MarR family winged helix-turn-helix transcriptional regulator [Micromonospora sp. NPDC006766]|uniref:MarR family winged helix-turn-helix transcriptional regulator n=1 Tax=Micromonospora sp. NPDC006766 TaxID=3154778 RepID=UPI003407515C